MHLIIDSKFRKIFFKKNIKWFDKTYESFLKNFESTYIIKKNIYIIFLILIKTTSIISLKNGSTLCWEKKHKNIEMATNRKAKEVFQFTRQMPKICDPRKRAATSS